MNWEQKHFFCNKAAQHSFQAGNLIHFQTWHHAFFSSENSLCFSRISVVTGGFQISSSELPLLSFCRNWLKTIHKAAPGASIFHIHNKNMHSSSSFTTFFFFYKAIHFFDSLSCSLRIFKMKLNAAYTTLRLKKNG